MSLLDSCKLLYLRFEGSHNKIRSLLEEQQSRSLEEEFFLIEVLINLKELSEAQKCINRIQNNRLSTNECNKIAFYQARVDYAEDRKKEFVETCETLLHQTTDHNLKLMIMVDLTLTMRRLGQYICSADRGKAFLSSHPECEDKCYESQLRNSIGLNLWNAGRLDEAIHFFESCKHIYDHYGSRRGLAQVLNNIALILHDKGTLSEALEKHQQAKILFEESKDNLGAAIALLNIGAINQKLGHLSNALDEYKNVDQKAKDLGHKTLEAIALNNIGNVLRDQCRYSESLEYLNKALTEFQMIDNPRFIGMCLANVGTVFFEQGKYEDALIYHNQALEIRRKLENPRDVASTLLDIIRTKFEAGMNINDEVQSLESEAFTEKVPQAFVSMARAMLNEKNNDYCKAESCFEKALTIAGMDFDYKIVCYKALAELSVGKWLRNKDITSLEDVHFRINQYQEICEQNNLTPYLCQVYLLKAKLHKTLLEVEEARNLLRLCVFLATDHGLPLHKRLAQKELELTEVMLTELKSLETEPRGTTSPLNIDELQTYFSDINKLISNQENYGADDL